MAQDPKDALREASKAIIDGTKRGFIVIGTFSEDNKMDTKASVQNVTVGDMAVALAGVVARVEETIKAQEAKKK